MHNLVFFVNLLKILILRPFKKKMIANLCGHETLREGLVVSKYGRGLVKMPLSANGRPDYCLDCIAKMTIRCTWCDSPIFIGDPVTLYPLHSSCSYRIPGGAVKSPNNPNLWIGCMRSDCAFSNKDCEGFWVAPGKIEQL
jgi:hypothetical protein